MIEYFRIVVLGIVQGITEFLPISSDGHLVVADALFRAFSHETLDEQNLMVTVILHMGTLAAILLVYHQRIWQLLDRDRRMIGLLIVGTIPAAVIGLLLDKYCEQYLVSPLLTGLLLPINGLMLLWINRQTPGEVAYEEITYRQAIIIGICQAFAPLPGISRSGTTIASGLALGLRRDAAATFSFMLAIPAIGGAGCVKLLQLFLGKGEGVPAASVLVVGAVVAFVVGWISLRLLLRLLREGILWPFGWWCIGLGAALLVWQWTLL